MVLHFLTMGSHVYIVMNKIYFLQNIRKVNISHQNDIHGPSNEEVGNI